MSSLAVQYETIQQQIITIDGQISTLVMKGVPSEAQNYNPMFPGAAAAYAAQLAALQTQKTAALATRTSIEAAMADAATPIHTAALAAVPRATAS